MLYDVTLFDTGLFSQAAQRHAVELYREALEGRLGGPEQVVECFNAYLRVSAGPVEDAAPKDMQACAKYTLAYFEAASEAFTRLVAAYDTRFDVHPARSDR